MRLALLSLLLCLITPASAEIYRYLDAKGNPVFSNQPPEGVTAQKIKISPINTVTSPPPATPAPADIPEEPKHERYARLELSGPPNGGALRANNGTFSVEVLTDPEQLYPGHSLRLLLDGQPYGQPTRASHFELVNIDRGEHRLSVEVMKKGQVIQTSSPLTFTVLRVHLRPPAP